MKNDPYGLKQTADDALRQWEGNAVRILVDLGVLYDGQLAPWYSYDDIVFAKPPGRPELKSDEVWEDRALPPVALGRSAAAARDLILE